MSIYSRLIAIGTIGALTLVGSSATAQQTGSQCGTSNLQAQNTPSAQTYPRATSKLNSTDRRFLTQSAQDSNLEFTTAQIAVQKATNPQIVQYPLRLLDDHAQYNKQISLLARKKGVMLPVELDQQQQSKLSRLMNLQGTAFDREYIRETAQANTEDVKSLQQESSRAQDPDVKAFVAEVLPIQQQHQQLARELGGTQSSQNNR